MVRRDIHRHNVSRIRSQTLLAAPRAPRSDRAVGGNPSLEGYPDIVGIRRAWRTRARSSISGSRRRSPPRRTWR
eukprot:9005204-Pyramimonas_sp.AAC.1